jgi:hypothetical protein
MMRLPAILKKQIVDQSAHALAAMAILAPVLLWPGPISGPISGAASGLGAGLVREITEGGNVFSPGSRLDLAFWSIGGALAALIFS